MAFNDIMWNFMGNTDSFTEGYRSGYADAIEKIRKSPKPGFTQSLLSSGHLDKYLSGYRRGYDIGLIHYNRKIIEKERSR